MTLVTTKKVILEGIEIPEQNLDYVLGFLGGAVQVQCTFRGDAKPPVVSRLEQLKDAVIEAVIHTQEGNLLSGIYVLEGTTVQQSKARKEPLWKVGLLLKRQ